jgi:hypothetical protein
MGFLVAFAAGYVLGARSGREELEEVIAAFRAVIGSEEVADLVAAARLHLGHTLRELAGVVDGRGGPGDEGPEGPASGDELVERVRRLVREG